MNSRSSGFHFLFCGTALHMAFINVKWFYTEVLFCMYWMWPNLKITLLSWNKYYFEIDGKNRKNLEAKIIFWQSTSAGSRPYPILNHILKNLRFILKHPQIKSIRKHHFIDTHFLDPKVTQLHAIFNYYINYSKTIFFKCHSWCHILSVKSVAKILTCTIWPQYDSGNITTA